MAFRFDTVRVDKVERTSSGALRVPAELTKAGVFNYRRADGTNVREYIPPEEIERAETIASLEDAMVTVGHPMPGVSPRAVSAGHVRAGSVRADGGVVRSLLVVAKQDAIDAVGSGDLYDISGGRKIRLDETPGVTPGGVPYDRVQRDLVFDHVALLRRGDGRLGTTLRLDGSDEQVQDEAEPHATIKKDAMKVKIRKDGREVEVDKGGDEHLAFLEAERDVAKSRADQSDAELARRDAAAADARRAGLESKARAVLGADTKFVRADAALTPLTDREIKVLVCQRRDSAFSPDGKTDAYVDVYFDLALAAPAGAPAAGTPAGNVLAALSTPAGGPPEAPRADSHVQARADAKKAEAAALNLWERK